jgi:uncharacterized membrane protein YphA (DoxX/SURF4 family)
MKLRTIFYWISTALIALETFVGGIMDLTHGRTSVSSGPGVADVLTSLGYPLYVLVIIGVLKIPGAITLVLPGFLRLKEWAYAGIVFELSGAIASHAFCGHTAELIAPSVLLALALASWALRPQDRVLRASSATDQHLPAATQERPA